MKLRHIRNRNKCRNLWRHAYRIEDGGPVARRPFTLEASCVGPVRMEVAHHPGKSQTFTGNLYLF